MKLSVEVQDQRHQSRHEAHHQNPLLLRAKIPLTIFNLPFLSGFSTTSTAFSDPSNLALSLATNFSSGPSLKLSFNASNSSSAAAKTTATPPLVLTLKSGIGLFGSPNNSPLIMSAHFSFSPQNPYPNPTFSLHFKPSLGNFSLRKTTISNPNPAPNPNPSPTPTPNHKANVDGNSFVFVPLDDRGSWKGLTLDSGINKDSFFSGFAVTANTSMPVTKRVALNLRWGLNVSSDIGKQMPFLTLNKVGIERVDQVKEVKEAKEKNKENSVDDTGVLKGMYFWMKKELDVLQKENREMKNALNEMKLGRPPTHLGGDGDGDGEGVGRKSAPLVDNSGGFEQWRGKKVAVNEKGLKESKKNGKPSSDVASELQKAIMAASSQ